MEDLFQAIADRAIAEAEKVECSLEAFAEGLETILVAVKERRDLALDEVRANEEQAEADADRLKDYE